MKLTIFKRLTFGCAAIILLVLSLGVYVVLKLDELKSLTRFIGSVDAATVTLTEHLLDSINSQVSFEKKFLIAKDPDFYKRFKEIGQHVDSDIVRLKSLAVSSEKEKILAQVQTLYEHYSALFIEEVSFLKAGRDYPRETYETGKDRIIDDLFRQLREITRIARTDRDKKIQLATRISAQVFKASAFIASVVVILGILVAFFNSRGINRSILLLKQKTKEIAKGRFEKISGIDSPPEISELADDFNLMCDRLKELDEMKVDFISHVSHELRTPLTAIREASNMLLEGIYDQEPKKQHELLAITKEECERLINSVNRILDLSRMEAKLMDYQFGERNLLPVIQKAVLRLAPIAQSKNIGLELEPLPRLPHVRIDEERIAQVLENLIGNALKFTPHEGRVSIKACSKKDEERSIVIEVSDTGRGIPREDLKKIFDRFKRIERGRGTERGTGLGLSIAKYIVSAHGGAIWAQSEPGKGSTFFFTLPVA